MFELLTLFCGALSGAIAAVAGFGIGSILTPLLASQVGTKVAVAAVSIPHLVATTLRFWMLRGHIDKKVFFGFGLMSAGGGLAGAFLHTRFESSILTMVFGGLLLFSGFMGLSGLSGKMRFGKEVAMLAGFCSGAFGGLVGNQGGIRSGALLSFGLTPQSFVATATAIGIIVDLARMPVYLATDFREIAAVWPLVLIAVVGTVGGTLLGMRFLKNIQGPVFQKTVSLLVVLLGVYMFTRSVSL